MPPEKNDWIGGAANSSQSACSKKWKLASKKLGRTKHARHAGRSLAALYMFSALYAPGRRNDRIQAMGKKRWRKRKTKAVSFWDVSSLTVRKSVYFVFLLYQMMVRLFPFLAFAVKMGFCVCQPLQSKMEWGKKAYVSYMYSCLSQTTLCHTLMLFTYFTAGMSRSMHWLERYEWWAGCGSKYPYIPLSYILHLPDWHTLFLWPRCRATSAEP